MNSLAAGVAVGAGIGGVIGGVYAANPGNLPSAFDIGTTLKNPAIWGLIGVYFVLSIVLLWVFFKPKSTEQIGAVIVGGVLWGTF